MKTRFRSKKSIGVNGKIFGFLFNQMHEYIGYCNTCIIFETNLEMNKRVHNTPILYEITNKLTILAEQFKSNCPKKTATLWWCDVNT